MHVMHLIRCCMAGLQPGCVRTERVLAQLNNYLYTFIASVCKLVMGPVTRFDPMTIGLA